MFLKMTYSVSLWTVLHVFVVSLGKFKNLEKISELVRVLIYVILLKLYDTWKMLITNTTGKIKAFCRSCVSQAYVLYTDHGLIVCGLLIVFL